MWIFNILKSRNFMDKGCILISIIISNVSQQMSFMSSSRFAVPVVAEPIERYENSA
jgi:hypothetical protein